MVKQPNTRSRVWNLLRTARDLGRVGITVATLATVLGAAPDTVLAAMLPDMLETDPAVYCDPSDGEPTLCPRRYPA